MINDTINSDDYISDGTLLPRALPFPFRRQEDVIISVAASGSGDGVVQSLNVHYQIVGDHEAGLASLVPLDIWPNGARVYIDRATTALQEFDGKPNVALPIKGLNKELDRHAMAIQDRARDIADTQSRALTVPRGEVAPNLPAADDRASKWLGFDDGGAPALANPNDLALVLAGPLAPQLSGIKKGDPGGNVMAIGLFTAAPLLDIPVGTDIVQTSGHESVGSGVARYSADVAVNAAYVAANPRSSFLSANGRGFRLVTSDGVTPAQFGTKGDGVTVETTRLSAALNSAALVLVKYSDDLLVSGLQVSTKLRLSGPGKIRSETENDSSLLIRGVGSPVMGCHVSGLTLKQKHAAAFGPGTANDWGALKLKGVRNSFFSNLDLSGADVACSIQFGDAALGDRQNYNITTVNFYAVDLYGMGLELMGCLNGHHVGHYFVGKGPGGGVGVMHGLRITGYDFAVTRSNFAHIYAENFANGVSYQIYGYSNNVILEAVRCTNGAQVMGIAEGRTVDNVCRRNYTRLIARDCTGYAVYDAGGMDNVWDIQSTGCANGIRAFGNGVLGLGNSWRGAIKDYAGRGYWSSQSDNEMELVLEGRNTTVATFGALLDVGADRHRGRIVVRNCNTGIQIKSNDNMLFLDVKDCTTGIVIEGSNNILFVECVGTLALAAASANNRVVGKVTGSFTDNGTNNDCSGLGGDVTGYPSTSGLSTVATNASGDVVITHGLGRIPKHFDARFQDAGPRNFKVMARSSTTITVRVFNGAAAVVSAATSFLWTVK